MRSGSESSSSIGMIAQAQINNRAILLIDGSYLSRVIWATMGYSYRIDFSLLLDFASQGRQLVHKEYFNVCSPSKDNLYYQIESIGIRLNLRGWINNGRQKGVDQELGHRILELHEECQPSVIILLAGDGDFVPSISRVKQKGARVEVIAGKSSISTKLSQEADITRFLGRKDLELLRYDNRVSYLSY
ncbi:MAG: NYN domain-containing protein [Candidatus Heimdallarchaeota archaeon]